MVVKQEALLKTPTLWVRGRMTSFSRIRTLDLLVETYPSYPEMDVFDNGKNKKVNLKKKKILPHFKQITRDLRSPHVMYQRSIKQLSTMDIVVYFSIYKEELS